MQWRERTVAIEKRERERYRQEQIQIINLSLYPHICTYAQNGFSRKTLGNQTEIFHIPQVALFGNLFSVFYSGIIF